MVDCQNLEFSVDLAQERLRRAEGTFGRRVVQRLICFTLYLIGAKRRLIADAVHIPLDSVKSIIKAVEKAGLPALEDRRRRTSAFLPPAPPRPPEITIRAEPDCVGIEFGHPERILRVSRANPMQLKVVLLSLLNSDLVSQKAVAEALGYTRVHTHNLAEKLQNGDVSSLEDKRKGQAQDYRITAEVKGELIQQFVLDVVNEERTSGRQLADHLQERCGLSLADRTVRYHLDKLGLGQIKDSLAGLLADAKKNSSPSC
jgi:biotin operon repressor